MSYQTANRALAVPVEAIPSPPKRCDACGADCSKQGVTQVLMVVVVQDQHERVGTFSDFCNETRDVHGKTLRTTSLGCTFQRWLSRCGACYQHDLDRSRRGKWNYVAAGTEAPTEFLLGLRP